MNTLTIALIYNPASGQLIKHDDVNSMFDRLIGESSKADYTFKRFNVSDLSEADLFDALKRLSPDQLWVAGGDGTVLSAAMIAMQLDIPLGVLPCGTMNLMARDLGMSLDIDDAFKQLTNQVIAFKQPPKQSSLQNKNLEKEKACTIERKMDMAFVNGLPFLNISNIGMSTLLTDRRENLRQQHRLFRWPMMGLYLLRFMFTYPQLTVQIKADKHDETLKSRSISITNNPLAPESSLIPSRSISNNSHSSISNALNNALDKGQLGVYLIKDRSLWSLPKMVMRLLLSNWYNDKDLIRLQARHVQVSFQRPKKRIKVMVDGELTSLSLPLEYTLKPKALKVLMPKVQEDPQDEREDL